MMFPVLLLIAYFAMLLFAVSKDKKSKNITEYFFAGRRLPFWALSITFIASWWGAGSTLSTADLAFTDGIGAFWYYGVPVLISALLMVFFSKKIRKVGFYTQGQMMKSRYNRLVSKANAVLIVAFMTFTAASQMVGLGDFFGSFLHLDYFTAVSVGTLIVVVYSIIGGFRGVVITDIIQFVFLLISTVAVLVVALSEAGGFSRIYEVAQETGKDDFFSFSAGAEKYLAYVITFGFAWAIQANVWQRISATRDDKDAKKMTIMSFIVYIPLYLVVVFTGMASIVLFDSIPEGGVVTAIVSQHMGTVLMAFVFVGICAAIMSTMDSVINTGAMAFVMDINSKKMSEKQKLFLSKVATLVISIIAMFIAVVIQDILIISWIASDIITTGVFIPLVFGFFWRRGNSNGAIASIIVGTIYSIYNMLIANVGLNLPSFWESGSATQVLLGLGVSTITYVSVSLLTKPEYEKADNFIAKTK